jgi:predicted trehalose synthase
MPVSSRTSQLLAGIAGAAMFLGAGLADVHAQQQPPAQPPAMPSELSQGQIETFADAAIEVQRVQQDFDAQVQAAENAEQIQQLQQQAQQDARAAIEDKGLTVDEYTAIVQAANQDPQLYAMIVETMQARAQ